MNFMVDISLKKLPQPVQHSHRLLLTGSCFTEHIGRSLSEMKFQVLQNPHGILFDPVSVCNSLVDYIDCREYNKDDIFFHQELWHSWRHHSRFSGADAELVLNGMNQSVKTAHQFLREADWLIITLGSSFSYRLQEDVPAMAATMKGGVANCHRAPASWFRKHLLGIDETITALDYCIHRLFKFNSKLQVIFTVSPVRHLRDGVVENNRSKARLIEAVHHMVNKFDKLHYFPAYELVIDVLRDYRFYDADLAHPNYMATGFVLEKFMETCIDIRALPLMKELKALAVARKHRPMHAASQAHRRFMELQLEKSKELQQRFPYLELDDEIKYFSGA